MGVTKSVSLPTRTRDWRRMVRTSRLVLSIPAYAGVALVAAIGSLSVFVLSRNLRLVVDVILLGSLSLGDRLTVLGNLYPGVGTAYPAGASILLVGTAMLVGVDVALVAYHLREHRLTAGEGSAGLVGILLGTLGAGCASCGSAVLAGLLSFLGVGGAVTLLPLDGLEFAVVALLVLVLSIHWLVDGMRGGEIAGCPVDRRPERRD